MQIDSGKIKTIVEATNGTPTAKLVAVLVALGITDNKEIAALTGLKVRAIQAVRSTDKAQHNALVDTSAPKCAQQNAHVDASAAECAQHSAFAHQNAPRNAAQCAEQKEKSPQTPLKEKLLPRTTVEQNISVAAACAKKVAAAPQAAPSHARIDLAELSEKITSACNGALASQAIAPGLASMSTPLGWIEAGADLDRDVIPALTVAGKKLCGKGIRSWEYFSGMVAEAKARREKGLPAVAEPKAKRPFRPSRW